MRLFIMYLSFDCATKTFAFILCRVDPKICEHNALDTIPGEYLELIDGDTVDLCPFTPDAQILRIERITALVKYLKLRIPPLPPDTIVLIEYQMGHNAKTNAIASALIAVYAEYGVHIVGPSLKNKFHADEVGKYSNFVAKYSTLYGANKAHTKHNFNVMLKKIKTPPLIQTGHVADCFMQMIGYILQK